jgi:DNA-binding NarL/FixJ family response regulator
MGETGAYPKARLLVVDDHAVARASLAEAVSVMADCEVMGEAATAAAALELIKAHPCDVVLLDISLPDAGVVDTMRALRSVRPRIAILIVSMHPEEQYAANLIRAGADGYFAKGQDAAELRNSGRLLELGKQLRCPVTAIHGDYDPHLAEGVQQPLAEILQSFRFILLKNCGHKPWIERQARDGFYAIVEEELRGVAAADLTPTYHPPAQQSR